MIKFLNEIPAQIPSGKHRYYIYGNYIYLFALIAHAVFIPVFYLLGNTIAFYNNILCVFFDVVCLLLHRRGKFDISTLIFTLEICCHTAFCILAFGKDTGLPYYFLTMTVIVSFSEWRLLWKMVGIMMLLITGIVFFEYARVHAALTPLPPNIKILWHASNALANFTAVAYSAYYFLRVGRISEMEIKKQLSEKEMLLHEVHHRIKNNMTIVSGLLTLQVSSIVNQEAKVALKDAIARVHSIRTLYDKLLLTKDYHDISIKSYIEGLLDAISAVFVMKNTISINKQITDFNIDSNKAISLGIIINELLTNVFKYAFAGSDNGIVLISVDKSDNNVKLIIQDNGVGIDEKIRSKESSGLGLTFVKMLAEQLKGTYTMESENGTKSIIQFTI